MTGTATGSDVVTAHYVSGTWTYVAAAPALITVDLGDKTSTNKRTYIDVQFTATVLGGGLDLATIGAGASEIAIGGTAVGTAANHVHLDGSAPISLGNGRYRYLLIGDFLSGSLDVTFVGGTFGTLARAEYSDGSPAVVHPAVAAYTNLESYQSIAVLGPTASIQTPGNGGVTGARGLNDRGYIDIAIVVPTGKTLDVVVRPRPRPRVHDRHRLLRRRRPARRHPGAGSARDARRKHLDLPVLDEGHLHERLAHGAVPHRERRPRLPVHATASTTSSARSRRSTSSSAAPRRRTSATSTS